MKNQDKYKDTVTIKFPNMIARVYIPDITTEERKRRIERIQKASSDILRKGV